MKLKPIKIDIESYPAELIPFMSNAKLYDSSSSPEARVIFIEKDNGYFLKYSAKGTLKREAILTKYFHKKNLSTNILEYISTDQDYLLTEKIKGDDCTSEIYLSNPKRLCDILAEKLIILHKTDFTHCPVPNHTELYIKRSTQNYINFKYDTSVHQNNFGYNSAKEAWAIIQKYSSSMQTNTLLHGDYCLPNIILNNWNFSGFIDLDCGGVGDRHVDIFWGAWTLFFNLKTDQYRERFFDSYGRDKIDKDMLRIVAAMEVFG